MATRASAPAATAAIDEPRAASDSRRVTFELPCTTRGAFVIVIAIATLLVLISFTMDVLRDSFDVHIGEVLYTRFSVDRELSIPTWFDATLLFVGALSIASIAARPEAGRWRAHWWGLAALFVLLSLDEAASIHEPLSNRVEELFGAEHLAASWILPGLVFVGVVGMLYWRFVWSLPRDLLWTVVVTGAIFVAAALGLDEIASQMSDRTGEDTIVSSALANLEELLEMCTIAIFVFALLRYRDSLESS